MKIDELVTDITVLDEIGQRLAKRRVEMNLTQSELSLKAGVSKRTIERLESGQSTQLSSFIRIIRSLNLLHRIDSFIPETKTSPMELLKHKGKERLRARSQKNSTVKDNTWTWGEDE